MKAKEYAYPQSQRLQAEMWTTGGLTKREKIAAMILQGMLTKAPLTEDLNIKAMCANAVILADNLLIQLRESDA